MTGAQQQQQLAPLDDAAAAASGTAAAVPHPAPASAGYTWPHGEPGRSNLPSAVVLGGARARRVKMTNISAFCLWSLEQRAALKAVDSPLLTTPDQMKAQLRIAWDSMAPEEKAEYEAQSLVLQQRRLEGKRAAPSVLGGGGGDGGGYGGGGEGGTPMYGIVQHAEPVAATAGADWNDSNDAERGDSSTEDAGPASGRRRRGEAADGNNEALVLSSGAGSSGSGGDVGVGGGGVIHAGAGASHDAAGAAGAPHTMSCAVVPSGGNGDGGSCCAGLGGTAVSGSAIAPVELSKREPHEFLGCAVLQHFGSDHGAMAGTLVDWHTETGVGLFRIAYPDGDAEDLPYADVLPNLITFPPPRLPHLVLTSAKRRRLDHTGEYAAVAAAPAAGAEGESLAARARRPRRPAQQWRPRPRPHRRWRPASTRGNIPDAVPPWPAASTRRWRSRWRWRGSSRCSGRRRTRAAACRGAAPAVRRSRTPPRTAGTDAPAAKSSSRRRSRSAAT